MRQMRQMLERDVWERRVGERHVRDERGDRDTRGRSATEMCVREMRERQL